MQSARHRIGGCTAVDDEMKNTQQIMIRYDDIYGGMWGNTELTWRGILASHAVDCVCAGSGTFQSRSSSCPWPFPLASTYL